MEEETCIQASFCKGCVKDWMEANPVWTCPMCRAF